MFENIKSAFDNGAKNVFVVTDKDISNNLRPFESEFSSVIYVRFDREKHVNYKKYSVDILLKYSIIESFYDVVGTDNMLLSFESMLDESVLLVIDNYNIPYPSPYLRHLLGMKCKCVVVGKREFSHYGNDSVILRLDADKQEPESIINALWCNERELLLTFCAMLYYFPKKNLSGENIIFNREKVRCYLGDLVMYLDSLVEKGLIIEDNGGNILVPEKVKKYVIECLKPDFNTCKTFADYCRNCKTFDEEFYGLYCYFSKQDPNSTVIIYNLLSNLVERGIPLTLLKNKEFYAEKLIDEDSAKVRICAKFIKTGKSTKELAMQFLVNALRNVSNDMYILCEGCFDVLLSCMKQLYDEIVDLPCLPDKMKKISEVVNILYPLFCCKNTVIGTAIQNPFPVDKMCIKRYGKGIDMSYSVKTIKLYGIFQKYLDEYISLDKKTPVSLVAAESIKRNNNVSEYSAVSENISRHFEIIRNTYGNFIDVFSPKNAKVKIYNCLNENNLEDKCAAGKRFLKRGFDGGTNTGAKRYAGMIMQSLDVSSNPLGILRMVLDFSYPVSDECIRILHKERVFEKFINSNKIPDREKIYFACELCGNYLELSSKTHLKSIYIQFIDGVCERYVLSESARDTLLKSCADMYVDFALSCMESGTDIPEECMSNNLLERFVLNANSAHENAETVLARALYYKNHDMPCPYSDEKIKNVLRCVAKGYEALYEKTKAEAVEQIFEKYLK